MLLNIVYIGNDPSTAKGLNSHPSFKLVHYRSGFEAYNSLNQIGVSPDAILLDKGIQGIKLSWLKQCLNEMDSSPVPFFYICDKYTKNEVKEWLKDGVFDVFLSKVDPDRLESQVVFTKKINFSKKVIKSDILYKIPFLKRSFDLIVASFAVLFVSPILLFAVIAIRLESRGKVYYTSKRVGTGYKIFDFYKLRSMSTDADSKLKDLSHLNQYSTEKSIVSPSNECPECLKLGYACSPILYIHGQQICEHLYLLQKKENTSSTFVKFKDDPRVTKVGKFIRKTSIDELPQLINVIRGDMSIVGNRPLPLYEAELLTSDQWSMRFMAPAGITGLWQIKKRGGQGKMSEEERKQLDNEYALNYSLVSDIKIILMTIPALLQKENV